jgi:predicted MFS family arabinose efflux permease
MARRSAALPARLVAALAVTQIIGWATTFNAPAILGRSMAADLGVSLPTAFAASTAFLVALALFSPLLAPAFVRFGAQRILMLGSLLVSLGLAFASQAASVPAHFAAWGVLGIGGAMVLSTAAHALLSEVLEGDAKRWIAAVMLASGLSASIGFPLTEALHQALGWRGTLLVFAGLHLFVCFPLHLLAVPGAPRPGGGDHRGPSEPPPIAPLRPKQKEVFLYLCAAVSLIGFVTWGLSVAILELLRSVGVAPVEALLLAAAVGFIQVAARFGEFAFASRASALTTATLAAAAMPLAFLMLLWGGGASWSAYAFVVIYGLASGIMSVARATLPLELFDPRSYGARMAQLALPMNLAFAASVPAFVLAIEAGGVRNAALLGLGCALLAFAAMCLLSRAHRRPEI